MEQIQDFQGEQNKNRFAVLHEENNRRSNHESKNAMMTLITGHMGFIGNELGKQLSHIGLDLKEKNNILLCDLPPAKTIIHLAAQSRVLPSIEDPVYDAETNIVGTIRLAKQYRKARFIFASSEGAIQKKITSPYGLSKSCAEEYIKLLHDDYVILRFPNVYGRPWSGSVIDKFINGPVVINGDGTATRDYVHVDDVVRAIKMAVDWPTGTYHLGSEIYYGVLELAKATGQPYTFGPTIEGEQQHTETKNTPPNWQPEIDVIDYIVRHKIKSG